MEDATEYIPPPAQCLPDIEVSEDLGVSSSLSSSVSRLVEIARRLTVCNQLQSALTTQSDELLTNEAVVESCIDRPQNTVAPTVSSASVAETADDNSDRSPVNNPKKWARLLGISPEDIGDEDEFIRTATELNITRPMQNLGTMSFAEQRTLRQSWNAALDNLEATETGNSPGILQRSSSWREKRVMPFFTKQVKSVQQDELLKMIASGKPSYEQVHMWRKSFEALLADKYGLALFKDFLATEFSDENIEFWIACEDYKTITQAKKQQARAQRIYEDFIATQACREINLDSVTRDQTISELSAPTSHTFENAQKRIQALMERDSYGRFLRSDLYTTLLKQAKQAARELAAAARDYSGSSPALETKFRLPPIFSAVGVAGGSGGVGTGLPGVMAAAADAEAGMNDVEDLELLGLSTSRYMKKRTADAAAASKRSTAAVQKSPNETPS